MEKTKLGDVVSVEDQGMELEMSWSGWSWMDTLGQHSSTHSVFTWVGAGPSMEGLTAAPEVSLTGTLTPSTQRFPTSCKLFISPFKLSC